MAAGGFVASLRGYPRPFWVINGVELLERLAYYGALSVTTLFLLSLGYSATQAGAVMGILLPLPYAVAVFAGPLAEKFGYKLTVLASLVVYAAGYLTLAAVAVAGGGSLWILFVSIVLLGIGAGIFKPLPAATVARTTTETQRNLGYTIYYWAINAGGFIGPVVIAFAFRAYAAAFAFAAATFGLAFLLTLFAFADPHKPDRTRRVFEAIRQLGPGFRDVRFVTLIAIYSGFWFVYGMNFSFLTPYIKDFLALPSWFPPSLQQAINPAVIILFGVPIGKFAERLPPLRMMNLGIIVFVVGFLLIGFSRSFLLLVVGMVIATAGEVLTQPGYLSLVSRIAPKDRVAVYQGMAFLPIAIGFMIGSFVGGAIYDGLVTEARRPTLFWAIICSVGLLTVAGFFLYNRWVLQPTRSEIDAGVRGRRSPAIVYALVALLCIPAVVGAGLLPAPVVPPKLPEPRNVTFTLEPASGDLAEGDSMVHEFEMPVNVTGEVVFRLTWQDEAVGRPGGLVDSPAVNEPDAFSLVVRNEAGAELGRATGDGGGLEVRVRAPVGPKLLAEVRLDSAGDHRYAGQTLQADDRNGYTLDVRGERTELPPP